MFFTGTGLSAESGIPTYRGQGGIWNQYNYEDYACQRAFDAHPEKVWEFHEVRRDHIKRCPVNDGHKIIVEIEKHAPETVIVTQNIDGMHQRAGARNVIELHGSLWRARCPREGRAFDIPDVPMSTLKCECGAYMRPDIVWFEDPMNRESIDEAVTAISQCDIIITIGTSGMVFPAAQLPFFAVQKGIPSMEINLERTLLSNIYQYHLQGAASEILQNLWPDYSSRK